MVEFAAMHEFSLCRGIVSAVLEEMGRLDPSPARLLRVRVEMGRLHQVIPEYLGSAWELLTRETVAEGGEIELVVLPIIGKCRDCGWGGRLSRRSFCVRPAGRRRWRYPAATSFGLRGWRWRWKTTKSVFTTWVRVGILPRNRIMGGSLDRA